MREEPSQVKAAVPQPPCASASGDGAASTATVVGVTPAIFVRGLAWSYAAFVSTKLLTFGAVLILARMLSPDDFGSVAIVLGIFNTLEVFGRLGLWEALIYEEADGAEAANLCFWVTLLATIIVALLTFAIAPEGARFFRDPRMVAMLRVLALTLIVRALGSTHDTLLRRRLSFKRKFAPDFGMAVIKASATIAFALAHFGEWSLIWGQVIGEIANVVLLWIVTGWIPTAVWSAELRRRMFRYARHIYVIDISSALLLNLQYFVAGRMLGEYLLGFYSMAFRIPDVFLINVLNVTTRVVFPAFSRLQTNAAALERALLATVRYTALFCLPVCVAFLLLARDWIEVFYGGRWLPAAPILQVLTIYVALRSISHHFGNYYKACGRPDILSKLTVLWWTLLPVALAVGARAGGIVGMAWGQVCARAVITGIHFVLLAYVLKVPFQRLWDALVPAVESSALLAVVMFTAMKLLPGYGPARELVIVSSIGAVAFTSSLLARYRDVLATVFFAVAEAMRRPATASAGARL